MDYAAFLHQQAAAVVEQFFGKYNIAWIGVPDLGWLTRRQSMDGGKVVALPGASSDEAVIWRDNKDRAELWVKPEEKSVEGTSLYSRSWRQFTRLVAQTDPVAELNGRKLAVDHLYPETAGTRLGLSLVRVMAVDRRSNSLVGSTTEKAAAGGKSGSLRPRFATPMTLAKVSGYQGSFAKRHDSATAARGLLDYLTSLGYPVPTGALGVLEAQLTASSLDWFRGDR
jgi:hypothetical protein